ncbi:MAG: hypothetical protein ACTSRS_14875 [Candidatus Helarchaeota archaeon]
MLQEIVIISRGGLGLFYQNFDPKAQGDEDLLASFFHTILGLAKESTKENLQEIITGNIKYHFLVKDTFTMVIRLARSIKEKNLKILIESVAEIFEKQFRKELIQNNTNVSIYDQFESVVKRIFNISKESKYKSSDYFKQMLGINLQNLNYQKLLSSL